jgi:hypothetical protein
VVAQGRLQGRPGGAGQHPGGAADRVDLGHPGQGGQVEGDHAGEAVPHGRLHPAHHTGAAAEGHHRHPGLSPPVQHGGHLGLGPGPQDQVGWVVDAATETADQVGVGAAEAMADPVQGPLGGDRGEWGRGGQPRGWQGPQPGGSLGRLQVEAQQRLGDGGQRL